MKDPHLIILSPHITEKSLALSYGDPLVREESQLKRQYTFLVQKDANKIEIKRAVEAIYNAGKKSKDDLIEVANVRTIMGRGKKGRRRSWRQEPGKKPDYKKAVITLKPGQMLEDYGV